MKMYGFYLASLVRCTQYRVWDRFPHQIVTKCPNICYFRIILNLNRPEGLACDNWDTVRGIFMSWKFIGADWLTQALTHSLSNYIRYTYNILSVQFINNRTSKVKRVHRADWYSDNAGERERERIRTVLFNNIFSWDCIASVVDVIWV